MDIEMKDKKILCYSIIFYSTNMFFVVFRILNSQFAYAKLNSTFNVYVSLIFIKNIRIIHITRDSPQKRRRIDKTLS